MYAKPSRKEQREQMFKRLQIGGVGIIAIMLMVAMASFLSDRMAGTGTGSALPTFGTDGTQSGEADAKSGEPLADLGVAPELPASDEKMAKTAAQPSTQQPVVIRPGGSVPDLKNPPAQNR